MISSSVRPLHCSHPVLTRSRSSNQSVSCLLSKKAIASHTYSWQDSEVVAAYEGDRSFNDLSAFVDNLSNNYARSLVLSPASAEEATYSGATNPDGEVLQLNPESFKKIKNSGDVAFIEFFAPWCGQCVHCPVTVRADVHFQLQEACSQYVLLRLRRYGIG